MRVVPIAAVAALALAGCTSYAPPPHEPGASIRQFESRRLDDPRLLALIGGDRGQGGVEWNLDTLARAAIYLSPDLEAARAKYRVSQAAIETARARPNPSLDASVGRAANPPAGESPGLVDLALGIRIETAGKRAHRVAQADALSESDRLDMHATAWQLRGRVRDALLEWSDADNETALLDRQVQLDRSIVRMLERRVELGEAAMGEKARADAALAQALLDRAAAASRVTEAKSRLGHAVGVPRAAIEGVRVTFAGLDARGAVPGADQLRHDALARDDLRAALARFAAADAAYRLQIAKQYPDVQFGPSYSYDTGTNKISIGVMSLTLPMVDRNQGPIAEARARRDEAASRFGALQASTLAELDRAQAAERDARERYSLAQANMQRAQEQLEATFRRFSAGEDDRLALAYARSAAHGAEKAALAAGLALQRSLGQLEDSARIALFGAADAAGATMIENGGPR